MFYSGKPVLGSCDADLYAFWLYCHLMDDSFGTASFIRSSSRLLSCWIDFINALDDEYSSFLSDSGDISSVVAFILGGSSDS